MSCVCFYRRRKMSLNRPFAYSFLIILIIIYGFCILESSSSSSPDMDSFVGESRVVGGVETEKHEFPEMVVGIFSGQTSLIRNSWALTAGHCCYLSVNPIGEYVYGGRHDANMEVDEPGQVRANITKVFLHPEYNDGTNQNDICLLKLDPPFTYSDIIQPIALPPRDYKGQDCAWVVSYRGHCHGKPKPCNGSIKLHKVDVPIQSDEQCEEWLNLNFNVTHFDKETMICAGYEEGGKDACYRDSGSPLLVIQEDGKHVQVGITSWGYGANCGKPKVPGVYVRLAKYVDWIEKTIADEESGQV